MRVGSATAPPQSAPPLGQKFNPNDPRYTVRPAPDGVVMKADGPPLAPALAKGIADEITASMSYHVQTLGWDTVPGIHRPPTVFVLSDAALRRSNMTVGGGIAIDGQNFVMSRSEGRRALTQGDRYRLNTEGHEDLHVLEYRVDKKAWNPVYFFEGLACLMSNHWAADAYGTLGYLRGEAQAMAQLTPAQGERVMQQFRGPNSYGKFPDGSATDVWTAELAGALALEFFRKRYAGGDFKALGAVLTAHGKGVPFPQAFQRQFGVPLAQAEAAFVQYLRNTQGDSQARLRGTSWAGYA